MDFLFTPPEYAFGVTIDQEHNKIHAGLGFKISNKISALTTGQSYVFLFKNAAATFAHLRKYRITATGLPVDIFIYEGPATTANGTELTIFNCNRYVATASNLKLYHTPTVTANGTQIDYELLTGQKQSGGTGDDVAEEWVLNKSTNYLLVITNNNNGSIDIGYEFFFYEQA